MAYKIVKKLTKYNFTNKDSLAKNLFIVVHYFGGLSTAFNVAGWFQNPNAGASAHLSLDEGEEVYQSVEFDDIAWHCGTKGTYYHPKCRNSNSIGIEVRPYILDKSQSNNAVYRGWYFGKEIEDRLVEVTRDLMKQFNIPVENVVRHYDVTHKYCPRPYVGSDMNLYYKTTGDYQWEHFKKRLEEDDEDMDVKRFKELYTEMRKELQDNDSSKYSEEARDWATKTGLIAGGGAGADGLPNYMWEDVLTREQFITVLYRFAKMMGKA